MEREQRTEVASGMGEKDLVVIATKYLRTVQVLKSNLGT